MRRIVFVVGPTAVGKTEVALHLARLIDAEIISCDSMQVYKHMDIGTQKPSLQQRKKIRHHMIDIISPSRNFSAAEFRKKALGYIENIYKKGKTPLFVGGGALYMKALIDGLFAGPSADRALRQKLLKEERLNGKGYLYNRLVKADPETAENLHPNDTRRIIRALEVYIKTDRPISELKRQTKGLRGKYDIRIFALNRRRLQLYDRIEKRVDKMFTQGFLKECRFLKDKRLSLTASKALGYKEVFDYLDSKISLREAKELIKKNTRHFAKRQLSWFRNDERIAWIDIGEKSAEDIAKDISLLCMR